MQRRTNQWYRFRRTWRRCVRPYSESDPQSAHRCPGSSNPMSSMPLSTVRSITSMSSDLSSNVTTVSISRTLSSLCKAAEARAGFVRACRSSMTSPVALSRVTRDSTSSHRAPGGRRNARALLNCPRQVRSPSRDQPRRLDDVDFRRGREIDGAERTMGAGRMLAVHESDDDKVDE